MANLEAQHAAARDRILKHMNADHGDSVKRYVEHGKDASFLQARDARMTDISLTEMRIRYGGKEAVIPFEPPMKSMREARERLVQLDKEAREALGRSDISITEFIPCTAHLGHFMNFTTCLITYALFCRSGNFRPGSVLFDNVLVRFPQFTNFCFSIQPYLFPIMIAIHSVEAYMMAQKMKRHSVTPVQRPWWLWVGTCFVEGVTSFWRLGGLIDKKRKQKEAKVH
ncbi:integral membrane protein-like protein [Sporormia fimetaria CBS 119925]|uniref:Integral membrane protein-like protein n=1 Tax=Sporormia fimetaria CBS 119925 TaxID=1340428 RepID=A0A6A6VEQ5_9PLEO|nr:integral membrane protein-like protein [Sporormia fimetaria CBS 119925]